MGGRRGFADLVRGASRRVRGESTASVLHRTDRPAAWYGDDLSPLDGLHNDELVRRLAVVRGRETELDAVLAARSTVQPTTLQDHEVERFFAQGYLVVAQLSSPEELAVTRMIYDELFEARAGRAEGLYSDPAADDDPEGTVVFPKIHQIYRFSPELVATGFMANARTIAGQLFAGQVEFLGGRGMLKPPFCPGATSWHQDAAYHSPDLVYRNVNFWLALQDSPVQSGAMQFVPHSHRGSVVHEHKRDHGHGLELADLSTVSEVVSCPLPAGGATLHHSYLLHHTAPNHTGFPRRALIAIFGQPPKPRSEPLRFPWQNPRPGEPGE